MLEQPDLKYIECESRDSCVFQIAIIKCLKEEVRIVLFKVGSIIVKTSRLYSPLHIN